MAIIGVQQGLLWVYPAGHGLVRAEHEQEIFISPIQMRGLLHQDVLELSVDLRPDTKGRHTGTVQRIVRRQPHCLVGVLEKQGVTYQVRVLDKHHPDPIILTSCSAFPKEAWRQALGKIVAVWVNEEACLDTPPTAHLTEILGDPQQSGIEIEIAIRRHGVPFAFSAMALQQVERLPEHVQAQDVPGREDLRTWPFVTIDGEDARDLDDAVYVEPEQQGKGWRLWVAVADVSHYVPDGSALDEAAYERATSVYFPRRVIPMLPEKLSNGLCSLNPNVVRLSLVCEMRISAKGKIQDYRFYSALIQSQARLTYTQVNAFLEGEKGAVQSLGVLQKPLKDFYQLYSALHPARQTRGALEFESMQTQVICNAAGQIERIEPYVRGEAHRMIEEAMLAANICAADFLAAHSHPGLFRVHEAPTLPKIQGLRDYLQALGLSVPWAHNMVPTAAQFQVLADQTRDRPDSPAIHSMLLRTMQQAIYTPRLAGSPEGHFGLALSNYTHFTSPIRRYPDLIVHRLIKALSLGEEALPPVQAVLAVQAELKSEPSSPSKKGGSPRVSLPRLYALAWQTLGMHCSHHERRADEASRDVQTWLKCQYMQQHVGTPFTGTVSAVTNFGLFVLLQDAYVEGLLHVSQLGSDYWSHDQKAQRWQGRHTGQSWGLGDTICVQVARVDIDTRKIDLVLASTSTAAAPTKRRSRKYGT
jgi:ribonuclease R